MSSQNQETIYFVPSRFEVAAAEQLTNKYCNDLLKSLKHCESLNGEEATACRRQYTQQIDNCVAQQVAYARMNCPVSFNALVQCLESSNNDMNACEHYLNEFDACINNLHAL